MPIAHEVGTKQLAQPVTTDLANLSNVVDNCWKRRRRAHPNHRMCMSLRPVRPTSPGSPAMLNFPDIGICKCVWSPHKATTSYPFLWMISLRVLLITIS